MIAQRISAPRATVSCRSSYLGKAVTQSARPARRGRAVAAQAVLDVDTANFEAEVLNADLPVVVDFWADWCGPCKLIAPLMDKLQAEGEGKIKVVKMEVDSNPDIVETYGVYGLPTLILFNKGAMVEGSKREGAVAMPGIKSWLESHDVSL